MKLKDFKKNFLSLKGDAHYIAMGVALGTFVGMTPFPGFRMLIAIALAKVFHFHKTAAALSVYSNNAFTGLFFLALNYAAGMRVLNLEGMPDFPLTNLLEAGSFIFQSGLKVFLALFTGGVVIGLPFAAIMYYLSYRFFKRRARKVPAHNHTKQPDIKIFAVN